METIIVSKKESPGKAVPAQKELRVSAYTWSLVISITSILFGVIWDISWHMSIGRDSLFSPPHLAIYLGGILSGTGSIAKLFMVTFGNDQEEKQRSVSFWGMKAPLGTLICIWGSAAMITSAPFDDWWHNAYGLDVKILSPPHALLFAGILGIITGTMLNVLSLQNQQERSIYKSTATLKYLFAYSAAIFLISIYIFIIEQTGRTKMHNPLFYQVTCGVLLLPIVSTMKGSRLKYPATSIAAFYTLILLAQLWLLPLIPAQPKLAPILNPVKHYVPLLFPLLIIFPAFALDIVYKKVKDKNKWIQAAVCGIIFFLVFLIVQYNFAYFLNSPYSRNWVFQTDSLPYYRDPNVPGRFTFVPFIGTPVQYYTGFLIAAALSVFTSYLALSWGSWMRRVQR